MIQLTRYTKGVIRCMNNKILHGLCVIAVISDFYSYMVLNQSWMSVIFKSYLVYMKPCAKIAQEVVLSKQNLISNTVGAVPFT